MKPGCGSRDGSSLVEATLVLPLVLLLLLNVVNFGIYIYAWVTVANAARTAAEYSIYNGIAVQFPASPTFSQIQNVVNNDVSSLPHYSASVNPSLLVCSNRNGTISTVGGSGTCATQADPEPALYASYSATVQYTYTPFISSFTIPVLNVPLTLPAGTITHTVTMRSMQ